jgi:hypothetical protein
MILVTPDTYAIPFTVKPLTDEQIAKRQASIQKLLADAKAYPNASIFEPLPTPPSVVL